MATVMQTPAVRSFKSLAVAVIVVALMLSVTLGLALTVWHTNGGPTRIGSSPTKSVTTQQRIIPDEYSHQKGPR